MRPQWICALALVLSSCMLTGCGGGGSAANSGPPPQTNPPLTIYPKSITLPAGSGQSYTFSGQGGTPPYQYAVLSGPGSISPSGIYTAGSTSGRATIQVTDHQGATVTATVASVFVRTNGPVYSAVTDGTSWYLGGAFNAVNAYEAPHMAVINANDGSPDLACDLRSGFDDSVYAAVSDGTAVYVGGIFKHYRAVATPGGLVRIDPATCEVLGTYFLPGQGAVGTYALSLYGSTLYAITQFGPSIVTPSLIKFNAVTGAADNGFQPSVPNYNNLLAFTPMALLATAAGVYFGLPGGLGSKFDATTGARDPSFSVASLGYSVTEYVAAGASLYVAGASVNGVYGVAKVDASTGAIDATFTPDGFDGAVQSITVVGNALYVSGSFTHYGKQQRLGIAKLNATTGALDPLFVPPPDLSGTGAAVTEAIIGAYSSLAINGSLYVAGDFVGSSGAPAFGLAKLDSNTGAVDSVFTRSTGLNGTALTICNAGSVLFVGGGFTTYRGTAAPGVAKLRIADGTADSTFSSAGGTDGPVKALLLDGGNLYLGGKFQHYGGAAAPYLAKVNADTGALDTTFTQVAGPDGAVNSLSTDGSSLYLAGDFTSYRGTLNSELVKVSLVDGSVAPGFNDGFLVGNASLVQFQGGYLYVFSDSTTYGTVLYPVLPRIDAQTGALDTTFPLLYSWYAGAAITFNGNGGYASVGQAIPGTGNPLTYVTKFDASTGAIDTNFHIPPDVVQPFVDSLLPMGSSLYVVSTSTGVAGDEFADYLAKVDAATGTPDPSFSARSSMTNAPMRVLATTGSDLWVGGDFSQYRASPAYYFVPINPSTSAVIDPQ